MEKLKKVSVKTFFTVLWRGVCQAFGWFFGLFGYRRDGKFAKCVWGVFAVSAAIIMAYLAGLIVKSCYDDLSTEYRYDKFRMQQGGQCISQTIGYVDDYYGDKGYLVNKDTGRKILKGIDWIAKPLGQDTLVCFSNGSKRGYFNIKDGKVIIEPKYSHAWVFSEGLAAVEVDGKIKFIDGTGQVVIDNCIDYDPSSDGYVFHGNRLVVRDKETGKYGLIDRSGAQVLDKEYDLIEIAGNHQYLHIRKDGQSAVYDMNQNAVLPFIDGYACLQADGIEVTMPDHTIRRYDYNGSLINDFYIINNRILNYDTREIIYTKGTGYDAYGDEFEYVEKDNKEAAARLMAYIAGDYYEGLMTAEGRIVTMPIYKDIEAIGPDTYLCTVSNMDKVVVNGNGEVTW